MLDLPARSITERSSLVMAVEIGQLQVQRRLVALTGLRYVCMLLQGARLR